MKAAAFQYCHAHPVACWPAFLSSDPPPSLRGNYTASSLIRGSPPLTNASILSASCCCTCTFSLVIIGQVLKFRVGALAQIHASCTPVAACPVIRCPADLSQKISTPLVLTTGLGSRRVIGRFAYARLSKPYMTWITTPFAITFTTTAFHRSSLWLFEASP